MRDAGSTALVIALAAALGVAGCNGWRKTTWELGMGGFGMELLVAQLGDGALGQVLLCLVLRDGSFKKDLSNHGLALLSGDVGHPGRDRLWRMCLVRPRFPVYRTSSGHHT